VRLTVGMVVYMLCLMMSIRFSYSPKLYTKGVPDFVRKVCLNSKAIPLQAWTGLEGSSRLSLPDFKTIGT
jgi:hypothetical protein